MKRVRKPVCYCYALSIEKHDRPQYGVPYVGQLQMEQRRLLSTMLPLEVVVAGVEKLQYHIIALGDENAEKLHKRQRLGQNERAQWQVVMSDIALP
jgi:hypothetical protein